MKRLFQCIILILSLQISAEEYRFVMNSGFYTPVSQMHFDENTHYLFTVSENGQLLILDTESQRVVKSYTLSTKTIVASAINPVHSELALVTVDDLQFHLEMWDWHRGVKLYDTLLNEKPLFIKYTTSGNSLILGKSSRPSITLLDHDSGDNQNKLTGSTQLFQDVYVGASGNTIMGYNLSGNLQYLQMSTGKEVGRVETKTGLSNLFVLQTGDKTITLAENAQGFSLLNRQTGQVTDTLPLKGLTASSVDRKNSRLSLIIKERGNQYLYQYDLSGGIFEQEHGGLNLGQSEQFTALICLDGICYLGTSTGDFFLYYLDSQEMIPFFDQTILDIQNIEVFNNALYIASENKLVRIESPFFSQNDHWEDLDKVKQTNQIYPNSGEYHLWRNIDTLIAYSASSQLPSPLLVSGDDGLLIRESNMAETLFYADQIDLLGTNLLTIKDNSSVDLYDLESGDLSFQWVAPSIEKSIFVDASNILLGKALSPNSNGNALESLNIVTGEISPLDNDLYHILDIIKTENKIYVLGLKIVNNSTFMVLTRYDSETLNKERELLSLEYEDYNSKIYRYNDLMFIPLSGLGFVSFDGRKSRTVETDLDVEEMRFIEDKMVLLYENKTLGFRNMDTLFEEVSMTFFSDYSWLAVYSDYSSYLYTPDARDNFFVYRVIKR